MSANRKYTQLSVEDVKALDDLLKGAVVGAQHFHPEFLERATRIKAACTEMLERTREVPGAHICLAYSVVRKDRN